MAADITTVAAHCGLEWSEARHACFTRIFARIAGRAQHLLCAFFRPRGRESIPGQRAKARALYLGAAIPGDGGSDLLPVGGSSGGRYPGAERDCIRIWLVG